MEFKYKGVKPKTVQSFTGVGFNGRAVLSLPTGETYDYIILRSNLPAARLEVKCKLNGKVFYHAPAEVFEMIEGYKALTPSASLLPTDEFLYVIPFADLSLNLKDGQQQTSLVTMVGEEFLVEVDIASKDPADPAIPTLSAHPLVNTPQPVRVYLPRLELHTITAPNAGENQFSSIASVSGRSIRRIHFKTNKIDKIIIKRDGDEAYNADSVLERYRGAIQGKVWNAAWTHLDFLQRGFIRQELFPTQRNSELLFSLFTSAATGSIQGYIEYLDVERPDLLMQAARK